MAPVHSLWSSLVWGVCVSPGIASPVCRWRYRGRSSKGDRPTRSGKARWNATVSAHPSIHPKSASAPEVCGSHEHVGWGLWSALIDSGTEHLTGEWDGWMDGREGWNRGGGIRTGFRVAVVGWGWVGLARVAGRLGGHWEPLSHPDLGWEVWTFSSLFLQTSSGPRQDGKEGGRKVEWHGRGAGYVRAACWPERRRASF